MGLDRVYSKAFESWKGLVHEQTLGGGNARFGTPESEEQKCLKKILVLGMFQVHDSKNLAINLALRENLDKYTTMLAEQYRSGLADLKKSNDKDKVGDCKVADRQVIEESLNFREQGPANELVIYEVNHEDDNSESAEDSEGEEVDVVMNKDIRGSDIKFELICEDRGNLLEELQQSFKDRGIDLSDETATIKKINVSRTKPKIPKIPKKSKKSEAPKPKPTNAQISCEPLGKLGSGPLNFNFDSQNKSNFQHAPHPQQNLLMKNFLSELTTKINAQPLTHKNE